MRYTGSTITFWRDLALGLHDIRTDTLMLALFESRDVLSPYMEFYDPQGECQGPGYTQGGQQIFPMVGYPRVENTFALACRFDKVIWSRVTLVSGGAVLYNETNENRVIACIDFGTHITKRNDDLIVDFPLTSDPLIYVKHPAIVLP